MFGRRSNTPNNRAPKTIAPEPVLESALPEQAAAAPAQKKVIIQQEGPAASAAETRHRSEEYYDIKTTVFNALIDTIDLTQLSKLEAPAAREEIRDIVSEIIQIKNDFAENQALRSCKRCLEGVPILRITGHRKQ